ncbi:MAG: retroviral-like aspartic protease family protein [Nostocaceae cyanobacterium]|nr:retroviral-like aspartic protease family protein [Nostocaceae cyanobacterium]
MPFSSRVGIILVSATLAVLGLACTNNVNNKQNQETNAKANNQDSLNTNPPIAPAPAVPTTSPDPPSTTASSQPSAYELALDRAAGAYSISQSAQAPSDWKLVIAQWQSAIALLKQVPKNSPDFTVAQKKITEYQRQVEYAQRQAARPRPQEPERLIAIMPETSAPVKATSTTATSTTATSTKPAAKPAPLEPSPVVQTDTPKLPNPSPVNLTQTQPTKPVFKTPIKRRIGGTPIIDVTFNGNQTFEMVVDTGASGTVITEQMAAALNVVPIAVAKANTASAKDVKFPVGYINSMEIAGTLVQNLPVAIAGSELEIGLLGHDFFGNYDVTIRQNLVEFQPR